MPKHSIYEVVINDSAVDLREISHICCSSTYVLLISFKNNFLLKVDFEDTGLRNLTYNDLLTAWKEYNNGL